MPRPDFSFHKLNEQGQRKSELFAQHFNTLCDLLEESLHREESRELSICYSNLESACFYAKKAMAKQLRNQEIVR